MSTKRRKRRSPEEIVRKLRDADALLHAGKDAAAALQSLEVSESTLDRWRKQYGEMKSTEAVRLKKLEEENRRLKQLVAEKELDIQMLKHIAEGNWRALPGSVKPSANCRTSLRRPSEELVASSLSRVPVSGARPSRATTNRR